MNQLEYWANETEYELEVSHPHRQFLINILATLPSFNNLLEVGCNIGQNLALIRTYYPDIQLAGIDVNARTIGIAKNLPKTIAKVGKATDIPFTDKSFDILVADAVLMYVEDIDKALNEAIRVTRKTIIIIDWESKKEQLIGHSLARDYAKLLKKKGLNVEKIKITKDIWPTSEKWIRYGQCFVCHLPSETSKKN